MQIVIDSYADPELFAKVLHIIDAGGHRPVMSPSTPESSAPTPVATPEPTPEPTGPSLQDAIDAATAQVGAGKPELIAAALAVVGGTKVRELPADKVAPFIEALAAEVQKADLV